MKRDLLQWLCCPECRADLTLPGDAAVVLEGELLCEGCYCRYPITAGVPRFVAHDSYVASFSYEWNKWDRVQLDIANRSSESENTFAEKTGFTPEDLRGRVVLDVGCGAGRFLDVASRWGARAIGVDFSFAVNASQRNLGDRENVDVIQADVFRLPFRDRTFDAIFSIGVLHHTRDTREAFLRLPRLLKEGGQIAVWLYYYPDELFRRASDLWRRVLAPLPHRGIYLWSWLLCAMLSGLYRRPFMGRQPWCNLQRVLPVNTHPHWAWRVLDTFDWYSPVFQDKTCSPERVIGWCHEGGLRDVEVLPFPTSIRAYRDSTGQRPLVQALPDLRHKRVMVFGGGAGGRQALEFLDAVGVADRVVAVCDNDPAKAGLAIGNHLITSFAAVPRHAYNHVVIASQQGVASISAQLRESGLVDNRDFFPLSAIEGSPDILRLASRES